MSDSLRTDGPMPFGATFNRDHAEVDNFSIILSLMGKARTEYCTISAAAMIQLPESNFRSKRRDNSETEPWLIE